MLRNILTGFVLPGIIVAILAMNYQRLLDFAQTLQLKNEAQSAIQSEQWDKAIALYGDAWKAHPQTEEYGLKLAWAYRQNKQLAESEAQYRQVLLRFPHSLNAQLGLIDLIKNQPGRVNEAIDQAQSALKEHRAQTALLNLIAGIYAERAEMPEENRESIRLWLSQQAAYYYSRSLEKNPKQFEPLFHLALAEHRQKHWKEAAMAYCQALLDQPNHYQARYNLGMALTAIGYPDAGFRQLDRATAILAEAGQMDLAMKVATQVQKVKNGVYESREKPKTKLGSPQNPAFLKNPACLQWSSSP
jgi:tetratricopeptide (TPR) repeat protein